MNLSLIYFIIKFVCHEIACRSIFHLLSASRNAQKLHCIWVGTTTNLVALFVYNIWLNLFDSNICEHVRLTRFYYYSCFCEFVISSVSFYIFIIILNVNGHLLLFLFFYHPSETGSPQRVAHYFYSSHILELKLLSFFTLHLFMNLGFQNCMIHLVKLPSQLKFLLF